MKKCSLYSNFPSHFVADWSGKWRYCQPTPLDHRSLTWIVLGQTLPRYLAVTSSPRKVQTPCTMFLMLNSGEEIQAGESKVSFNFWTFSDLFESIVFYIEWNLAVVHRDFKVPENLWELLSSFFNSSLYCLNFKWYITHLIFLISSLSWQYQQWRFSVGGCRR